MLPGWNPIAEYAGHSVSKSYTWGMDLSGSMQGAGGVGGLLRVTEHGVSSGSDYYPTYDGNGNVSEYLDASGALVAHYECDAFGNTLVSSGSKVADFAHRFSTKLHDAETGLYYYGYRYYDPVSGRWPSRDPIEEKGGLNVYGFVNNVPSSNVDVLGMSKSKKSNSICPCLLFYLFAGGNAGGGITPGKTRVWKKPVTVISRIPKEASFGSKGTWWVGVKWVGPASEKPDRLYVNIYFRQQKPGSNNLQSISYLPVDGKSRTSFWNKVRFPHGENFLLQLQDNKSLEICYSTLVQIRDGKGHQPPEGPGVYGTAPPPKPAVPKIPTKGKFNGSYSLGEPVINKLQL